MIEHGHEVTAGNIYSFHQISWPEKDFYHIEFHISVNKDELDSKVDSTLSKVEGLLAKSGEIEIRFNEVDNIHQEIKGKVIRLFI